MKNHTADNEVKFPPKKERDEEPDEAFGEQGLSTILESEEQLVDPHFCFRR